MQPITALPLHQSEHGQDDQQRRWVRSRDAEALMG